MNFELITALWTLDHLPSSELPKIATDALAAGYDSPTLRVLAGETKPEMFLVAPLFLRTLKELGIKVPGRIEAGKILAAQYAEDIVAGRISPYEGARKIWWEVSNEFEQRKDLLVFVGLASEYEDFEAYAQSGNAYYKDLMAKVEQDILSEAKLLLENKARVPQGVGPDQ